MLSLNLVISSSLNNRSMFDQCVPTMLQAYYYDTFISFIFIIYMCILCVRARMCEYILIKVFNFVQTETVQLTSVIPQICSVLNTFFTTLLTSVLPCTQVTALMLIFLILWAAKSMINARASSVPASQSTMMFSGFFMLRVSIACFYQGGTYYYG